MSIYPERIRGKLTGRYKVEAQLKGQRLRDTCASLDLAKAKELQFKHDLVHGTVKTALSPRAFDKRDVPKTLGQLYDKAAPSIWRGMSTEAQSLQRSLACVNHIGPSTLLGSLDVSDIDELVDLLVDKSPATVNRYLSALHTLLAWARDRKYLQVIPMFPWQAEKEGRIRWITEIEEDSLYKALGESPVALVVKVGIATGMRRNELLGITKEHLEASWVRVWETKADLPRSVPITAEIHDILELLLTEGTMPTQAQLRYHWDKAKEAIGLKDDPLFVFHACRHTCATRLVRANVNIRIIQRWLGHKRIETTLRYAHVNDTMLTDALSMLMHPQHQDVDKVIIPNNPAKLPEKVTILQSQSIGMLPKPLNDNVTVNADVVKLVDTQDLGSSHTNTIQDN